MRLTRLKVLLLRSPLRQFEIAGRSGVHPTTLSDYANGKRQINQIDLRRLMQYFQLPAEEILGDVEVEVIGNANETEGGPI